MADLPARFGPYEIQGHLGSGGMGKVFRARDTRLQRQVAIKILDDAAAMNPERQRRFAREAIAASALNHPNIVTVFDVGVEGEVPYLVSELIEGESLRAELDRGRLPLKRTIDIACQIADGLCAAHEAGIVHRDLKPENVMITTADRVKIVDFGLAKATDDESALGPGAATQTAAGLIMGTVPYMSPEQARGDKADFRSDQFALGVILFEMTTGTHPFKRDTAVQTMSAIIADEPPEAMQLNPAIPITLRWSMRRLLAKKPRERFAHTADLAADLRLTRDNLSEATLTVVQAVADRPRHTSWSGRNAVIAGAVALVAGLVGGRALTLDAPRPRFDRLMPFATDAGYQGAPSWSPDGKTLAYEAEINGVIQIFTRTLGSTMRTQVTNSRFDCYAPLWSADGTRLLYHSAAGEKQALWQVSAAGGAPELLIEGAYASTISPDGRTIVALREHGAEDLTLWISAPPGAEPRPFGTGQLAGKHFSSGHLRFAPDGSTLLAWLWQAGTAQGVAGFWSIALPGGEPRPVLASLAGFRAAPVFSWLPDGRHVVLVRDDGATPGRHLWLADVTNDRLWQLTETASNEGAPSVGPAGQTVAFSSEVTDFDLIEVPLDGSAARPFWASTRNEFDPAASPVSTQYAFVTDRTGKLQIWLQNEEGYLQQQLVTDDAFNGEPAVALGSLAFSPDGKRLAFQRFDTAHGDELAGPRIWISSVAGGRPIQFGGQPGYQDAPSWSPDGEWIAYTYRTGKGGGEFVLVKGKIGSPAHVTLRSGIPPFVARPRWSPDGKWILCETNDGLTLISPEGGPSRVVSDSGWFAYAWSADGRLVYGLRPTEDQHHFMFVSVDVTSGVQRILNPNLGTIPPANQPIRGFSQMRNGRFLTSIAHVRSDIYLIEGLRPPTTFWQRLSALRRPE